MKNMWRGSGRPAPRANSVTGDTREATPLAGLGGRVARVGAFGLAAVVVGFLMCGCGASADEDTTVRVTTKVDKPATSKPAVSKVQASAASTAPVASSGAAKTHAVANAPAAQADTPTLKPAAGLPPDIVVSKSDSVAAPGGMVYLTVRATDDVSQIVLRDGIGDSQGLVYDDDARVWRLTYRVPLSTPWERVGLSLTAKNRNERWCRVWTFVRVREEPSNEQIRLTVGS